MPFISPKPLNIQYVHIFLKMIIISKFEKNIVETFFYDIMTMFWNPITKKYKNRNNLTNIKIKQLFNSTDFWNKAR